MFNFESESYANWLSSRTDSELCCDIECVNAFFSCSGSVNSSFIDMFNDIEDMMNREVCKRFEMTVKGVKKANIVILNNCSQN